MKTRFPRTLVLVLTALVAVSVLACADGSREYEVGYFQAAVLKESPESLTPRPDRQALYHLPAADSGRSHHHSRASGIATKSTALVCLSTCVLLC